MTTAQQSVEEQPAEPTTDHADVDAEHQAAQATSEVFESRRYGGR